MPYLGEVKKSTEIRETQKRTFCIWVACESCGKERWVELRQGKPRCVLCRQCSIQSPERRRKISESLMASQHPNWKGGRYTHSDGYKMIYIDSNDFYYPMTYDGHYVLEHRLVVAKALGRCLQPWEIVHHKGDKYPIGSIENRQDNRYPENLELTTRGNHSQEHAKGYADGFAKGLQDGRLKQIQELKHKIRELEEKANGSK